MTTPATPIRTLARLGWINLGFTALFGLALLVDPRTVDGVPLWLKPAKFSVSLGLYALTFAWILRHLTDWPRVARVAATMTSVAFVVELLLITGQAARGVASHFNVTSAANATVYAVMGMAIGLQTLASLAVTWALWRQAFTNRALGWAMRLGMLITVLGASTGGLMTQPTRAQLAQVAATGVMPRAGQHSVGGEDGGAGLPGTGWSLAHGDLRVPHFLGLHAMQVLPLAALWLTRRRRSSSEHDTPTRRQMTADSRVIIAGGISYGTLFGILLAQALVGQSVAAPAGPVAVALGAWAVGSALALASAVAFRDRKAEVSAHLMGVA